jgi:hypothetical protein
MNLSRIAANHLADQRFSRNEAQSLAASPEGDGYSNFEELLINERD